MFRNCGDEIIWRKIVDNTINQKEVLPVIYYKPFKASKLFIRHRFPDWNIEDYVDKFYNAEKYFNVTNSQILLSSLKCDNDGRLLSIRS